MSIKIYVVTGESGEYSDRDLWVERAFYQEEDAKQFILKKDEEKRSKLLQVYQESIERGEERLDNFDPRYTYAEIDLE
jgi:hypothetical protein